MVTYWPLRFSKRKLYISSNAVWLVFKKHLYIDSPGPHCYRSACDTVCWMTRVLKLSTVAGGTSSWSITPSASPFVTDFQDTARSLTSLIPSEAESKA